MEIDAVNFEYFNKTDTKLNKTVLSGEGSDEIF